jgi:hypothetical protein
MISIPERIFFGIPSIDRRIDIDCVVSTFKKLHECGGEIFINGGVSDIALTRNIIAKRFLKSNCDWLMMIDSDIIFSDEDWGFLWNGDEDIVTAPYARKIPGQAPANYGLGFTRAHRRVFTAIDQLETEQGSELASRFYMDGEMYVNYFPGGVTGDSRWLGEDRGFFTLCQIAGLNHRLETRTRLGHVGLFVYGYPTQNNGAHFYQSHQLQTIEKSTEQCSVHGLENCEACTPDNRPIVVM